MCLLYLHLNCFLSFLRSSSPIEISVCVSASGLVICEWRAEINADISWVPIVLLKIIEPMGSSPSVTRDTKLQSDSSQLELVSSVYFGVEFQDVA